MKLMLVFNEQKCSACGACAIACMDQNDIAVDEGQHPYRKVYQYESGSERVYISISCLHCTDAPCVTVCPVSCLHKDPETGLTKYDNTSCIGCHSCSMACPYGAPSFRGTGDGLREKMEKCHGCAERIKAGLSPACVHSCPTGALTCHWVEDDEPNPLAALYSGWQALH